MPEKVDRHFDSLTEFVQFALRPSKMQETSRSSRTSGHESFYGSSSFSDAQGMAFDWKDGADRVNALRAKVSLGNVAKAKTIEASKKAPGRLDMGRVMISHPYAFVRAVDSDSFTKGKSRNVVDILLNACVSAWVSTETIEARGAAMLALAEALEQSGKRVRITVGMANESGGGIDYKVVVKQPNQKLNLSSVAFSIAHPSFFRRFVFSAMETEKADVRKATGISKHGGYGRVGEFYDVPESTIYMGGADLRESDKWNNPEYVQEWIKATMREQGIEIR